VRNIVHVIGHEDQIIAVLHVKVLNDAAAERLAQGGILQLGFPELGEQLILLPLHDLAGGEADIQQVFAQSAGERLLQQREIFFRLGLAQQAEGFIKARDDLLICVYITSIDMLDVVVVRAEAAPDLAEFFLIHGMLLWVKIIVQGVLCHRDGEMSNKKSPFPLSEEERFIYDAPCE
jgi:hypothetical protein